MGGVCYGLPESFATVCLHTCLMISDCALHALHEEDTKASSDWLNGTSVYPLSQGTQIYLLSQPGLTSGFLERHQVVIQWV